MTDSAAPSPVAGKLADNVVLFGRTLRSAGMPVDTGRILNAVRAVETAGLTRRDDFYWALHAHLVSRHDHHVVFDQAFHAFWRDPELLKKMLGLVLPLARSDTATEQEALSRRVADAMGKSKDQDEADLAAGKEADMTMSFSDRDALRDKDFASMSTDEIARAKKAVAAMTLRMRPLTSRRMRTHASGDRVDMRATMRAALRGAGDIIPLERRRRRTRPPALVLLCDISGSMSGYSQMLVHFAHALTNDRDRVHTFLFGTRLTNITRQLRHKDVDVAMADVADTVDDWSGGTRIGGCLHTFNREWSRRLLAQGAVVVMMTDGLDRDAGDNLASEMERLHLSSRRLIWLNPLLRYDGFEPKSWGIRTMLPHVDVFRSAHSLASLEALAALLGDAMGANDEESMTWRQAI
ncbi:MAG: VWA domain-containing protein [Pseudomonadota bacterium]